jgi:hypothetical protein
MQVKIHFGLAFEYFGTPPPSDSSFFPRTEMGCGNNALSPAHKCSPSKTKEEGSECSSHTL